MRQHQSSLTYLYSGTKGSAVLWIRILVHSGTFSVSTYILQRESHEQAGTFNSLEGERKNLGRNRKLHVLDSLFKRRKNVNLVLTLGYEESRQVRILQSSHAQLPVHRHPFTAQATILPYKTIVNRCFVHRHFKTSSRSVRSAP
jgi:hypothetical protein